MQHKAHNHHRGAQTRVIVLILKIIVAEVRLPIILIPITVGDEAVLTELVRRRYRSRNRETRIGLLFHPALAE